MSKRGVSPYTRRRNRRRAFLQRLPKLGLDPKLEAGIREAIARHQEYDRRMTFTRPKSARETK